MKTRWETQDLTGTLKRDHSNARSAVRVARSVARARARVGMAGTATATRVYSEGHGYLAITAYSDGQMDINGQARIY